MQSKNYLGGWGGGPGGGEGAEKNCNFIATHISMKQHIERSGKYLYMYIIILGELLINKTIAIHSLKDMNIEIYNPRNTQAVELYFRGEKMAKVMGSLAAVKPSEDHKLSGVLVKRGFNYHLIDPSDLSSR